LHHRAFARRKALREHVLCEVQRPIQVVVVLADEAASPRAEKSSAILAQKSRLRSGLSRPIIAMKTGLLIAQ